MRYTRMYTHFVESSWNVMAHGDAQKGKWRGNWRMEWVASTLHTTSEHVSSITTADAHNSAASSRLYWRPRRFKWIRPFRLKTKSGFCACAITFQLASTSQRTVFEVVTKQLLKPNILRFITWTLSRKSTNVFHLYCYAICFGQQCFSVDFMSPAAIELTKIFM